MATKRFLPVLPAGLTRFEETIMTGDPDMRGQTVEEVRDLQLVYRREQARQLNEDLKRLGLNPDEIEYYASGFEKNLCPSTGLESESGILYNTRTGVSVGVVLEWVCEWSCGLPQWRGQYQPRLETCKPVYFLNQITEKDIESLK
jgi:hypothetical protein